MKILIRNSDNVVVYAQPDLTLSADGLHGDGWFSPHFTSANAHLDDAELPPHWVGGVWTYIGGEWAVSDTTAHDATLGALRAALWEQIKAIRDRKTQTGGYTTGGKWYHSDTFSRTQQMGLVMMGASVPAVPWKTMDGTFATMTQTLAGQIFAAAAAQDQALFANAEALRTAVNAASDPASVDIGAGWPATFGG